MNSDNDSTAISAPIWTAVSDSYPVLETRIISNTQDVKDLPPNSVWIGQNVADRGRSTIHFDGSNPGLGNLGLKFENLSVTGIYKKTFQSYLLNKEDTGRLYLMVVGTETDNTSIKCFLNPASNADSVDIFELPGRPLIANRIK